MNPLVTILALIIGGYMLIDGIYVILKGKYIDPEKSGLWANLFNKLNIDVFQLGPLFICMGLFWLIWIFALWANQIWTFGFGLFVSVLTLWYISVGTLFSIIIVLLFAAKHKLRI
ncbi:MAG: hypothetical protein HOO91_05815 [Bacteroidales bacterium]|nr:hypothetical protein [Bacteroidales bacterium]